MVPPGLINQCLLLLGRCAAYEALLAYPGGLQVGGGVNADNAFAYLDAGASHVIVTSYIFREGRLDADRLKQMVQSSAPCCLVSS